MRICDKCGATVEETEQSCPFCGYIFEQPITQPSMKPQPTYEQPVNQPPYQAPVGQTVPDKYQGFPMKWYKFLVYFALWAGSLLNAVTGIRQVTGTSRENADILYSLAPSLKTCDIIFGILMILVAVLGVLTAIKLLQLSAMGPKLLMLLYIANAAISLIEMIVLVSIVKGNSKLEMDSSVLTSVIVSIVVSGIMVAINWIYFKKRESIFVN